MELGQLAAEDARNSNSNTEDATNSNTEDTTKNNTEDARNSDKDMDKDMDSDTHKDTDTDKDRQKQKQRQKEKKTQPYHSGQTPRHSRVGRDRDWARGSEEFA